MAGNTMKSLTVLVLLVAYSTMAYAQGPCGGKPCPVVRTSGSGRSGNVTAPRVRPPRPGTTGPHPPRPVNPAPICEDSQLAVVCGMPGCEITLNGKDRTVTDDLGGITFQVPGNQQYRIRVTKPGYEEFKETVTKVGCDDQREVKASLTARPVTLRVRTQPAECDIYLDGQKQPSGSDSKGVFSYLLAKPTLLIEARKKGYLSDTKNIFLAPELTSREIVLALDPISASVRLSANVENTRVTINDQKSAKPINERILLPPGSHTITVDALGYTPVKLELSVGPDESLTKQVTLQRLPLASLQTQATTLFLNRAYDDVLKLSGYIFESDRANATAHRLMGLVFVERGDFASAASHVEKALVGSETIPLRVRRHLGEKFELNRGHDLCEAQLTLSKTGVDFKSLRNPAENFKATYDQIQVIGIQVKSSVAAYLSTKVTIGGKRRDFNFYNHDKELSQAGKPYLEMIQRLLRPH